MGKYLVFGKLFIYQLCILFIHFVWFLQMRGIVKMEPRPSTSSVAVTSKGATVRPSPICSSDSTIVQQQPKEKLLFTMYRASLEQCHQLFGATCRVRLQRCQVPADAPQVPATESNPVTPSPSSETESCSFFKGDKEKVFSDPPLASSSNKTSVSKKRGQEVPPLKSSPAHCRVCGKTMASKPYLKVHMRKHTGEKRYRCEQCGRSFWESSSLTKHKKRNQQNGVCPPQIKRSGEWKPKGAWKCKICGRKKKYGDSYEPHMTRRHGLKPLKCSVCGNGFTTSWELSRHKRIHTGVWNYSCVFCDKGFHQQADLFRHLRVHTEEKPYFCKVKGCGASFRELKGLRRHHRRSIHLKKGLKRLLV